MNVTSLAAKSSSRLFLNLAIDSGHKRALCALFLVLSVGQSSNAFAADNPFASANVESGKSLYVEKKCAACHIQKVGGDGSSLFTRTDRKVTSSSKLLAQVNACNSGFNIGMLPDQERNVAAYLNAEYYKFKQ